MSDLRAAAERADDWRHANWCARPRAWNNAGERHPCDCGLDAFRAALAEHTEPDQCPTCGGTESSRCDENYEGWLSSAGRVATLESALRTYLNVLDNPNWNCDDPENDCYMEHQLLWAQDRDDAIAGLRAALGDQEAAAEHERCPTCDNTGMAPATGRGNYGYDPCDDPFHAVPPSPPNDETERLRAACAVFAAEARHHQERADAALEALRFVDEQRRYARRCVGSLPLEMGEHFERRQDAADAIAAAALSGQQDPAPRGEGGHRWMSS